MNDFLIFGICAFLSLYLGTTFAFMFKMMTSTFEEMDKPTKTRKSDLHPEMQDVKSGEQLLVFNPSTDEDDDAKVTFLLLKNDYSTL